MTNKVELKEYEVDQLLNEITLAKDYMVDMLKYHKYLERENSRLKDIEYKYNQLNEIIEILRLRELFNQEIAIKDKEIPF